MIWLLAIMCAIPASFSYIKVFKVNSNVSFSVSPFAETISFIDCICTRYAPPRLVNYRLSSCFPWQRPANRRSTLLPSKYYIYMYSSIFKSDFLLWFKSRYDSKACYPYPTEFGPNYPRTILVCRFFIFYAVPLSIIAFFYILMARHLMHSTRNIPGEMQCQVRKNFSRRRRIILEGAHH